MALSPQWLDELRARITLSTVIGRHVRLQKAGREFKACCPFHDEKTPSFTINDAKGFYHCFGCGAHGDAIRWMTDQRGLAFMDAVKELAVEAGMEVPAPDPQSARRAEERAGLQDVTAAAQEWFVANLGSSEGTAARGYLARRGFSAATMREFGFGYAPEGRQALGRALARFEEPLLVEAGMRISVEERDPYDRFRNRLMLPIQDARGRVIAFGGRILDAESNPNAPKYLNSPDTPLFDKGRTLYNLHRAAPAARQSGRMIVVEGYMDVIALAEAGIGEAVAPMGTALTEQQLELLWRHVERPILCFDGDAAGQRAMRRAVERALPFAGPGKSLAFVFLPSGEDPDDLIQKRGPEAFKEILANAVPMVDTIWNLERYAEELETPEQKAGLKARLIEHIEAIKDTTTKSLYRRELFDIYFEFAFPKKFKKGFGFKEDINPTASAALLSYVNGGSKESLSRGVLAGFARRPHLISLYIDDLWSIRPRNRELAEGLELLDAALILMEDGHAPPSALQELARWPGNRAYPFLNKKASDALAEAALAQALKLLIKGPALERDAEEAEKDFTRTWSEEDQARKFRALTAKLKFNEELKEFRRLWDANA
jgi:DNA primase